MRDSSSGLSPAAELALELRPAIADDRVLAAMASIPRERFVPPSERRRAYANVALPIARDQTISQPLVVARMCELLAPARHDAVLDVGTGSGYHAAVLARLAGHVWSIERLEGLSRRANVSLAEAGIDNVTLVVGDGAGGLPEHAPYDAINVGAAADGEIPPALEQQLGAGGRLVAPVQAPSGPAGDQRLVLVRREADGLQRIELEPVRFVPLVGERLE